MSRLQVLLLTLGCAACLILLVKARQRNTGGSRAVEDRVAVARNARDGEVRAMCTRAGVTYPPHEVFLRAFKQERVLELWATNPGKKWSLVREYPLTASSGKLGPKRKEGDRQIPEGFYLIDRFNPRSSFHLSLGLNYPNRADRILGDPSAPGTDIFIHGNNLSIGCLAVGDRAIEEIYLLALDATRQSETAIHVHIFPARMNGRTWEQIKSRYSVADSGLAAFWGTLQSGFDVFERNRIIPRVIVKQDGSYALKN